MTLSHDAMPVSITQPVGDDMDMMVRALLTYVRTGFGFAEIAEKLQIVGWGSMDETKVRKVWEMYSNDKNYGEGLLTEETYACQTNNEKR